MKKILSIVLFLSLNLLVKAQIPILEIYKKQAVDNNKGFQSHQMLHHAFLEKESQFSRLSDLQITAGYSPSPIETRLGAQTIQFSAVQKFPWFGTLQAKLDLFEADNAVHNKLLGQMEANLNHRVVKSWMKLYEVRLNKSILRDQIELVTMLETMTLENLRTQANSSAIDVLNIGLKKEEWENTLADLERFEKVEEFTFNTLLSRDLDTEIKTIDSLIKLDSLIPMNSGTVYEVNKQGLKTQAAHESIQLVEKKNNPTWSIGFKYFVVEEGVNAVSENGRDAYMVNLGLTIPFQVKHNKHAMMEATHKWHYEQIELEKVKEEYERLLASLILDIEKHKRDFNHFTSLVEKVDRILKLSLQDYSHGNIDYSTILEILEKMLSIERNRIAAVIQQHTQISFYNSLFDLE